MYDVVGPENTVYQMVDHGTNTMFYNNRMWMVTTHSDDFMVINLLFSAW